MNAKPFRIKLLASVLALVSLSACNASRIPAGIQSNLTRNTSKVSAKWVTKNRSPLIPGEIVVETRSGFATKAFQAFNTSETRPIQRLQIKDREFTLIEVKHVEQTNQVMSAMRSNPQVLSIAPNPRYTALNTQPRPMTPVYRRFNEAPALNDALIGLQWSLPRIGIPQAWSLANPGSKEVIVAVVDSGVDYQHPDLKDQIINGKDFMAENPTGPNGEGSPDTVDDDPLDQYGHGTHVAGIIGALPNNATGIAGIAPGVKILNIRVLNGEGWGSAFAIAQGITYAADHGARIINLSLGSGEGSKPIELAVKYAQSKGALIIAAAGNSYTHTGYPASYPGVLAVGATNDQDWLADFSNHDARINVVAPGVDIMSTTPTFLTNSMANNGIDPYYSTMSGTSMACPMVSAQAALLLSQNPTLKAEQIMDLIQKSAKPIGDPRIFGHGRIQIDVALRQSANLAPPAADPAQTPGAINQVPGQPVQVLPPDDVSYLPAPVAAQRVRR